MIGVVICAEQITEKNTTPIIESKKCFISIN
jgi:hypothetical protein